jgi:hypothetical protein
VVVISSNSRTNNPLLKQPKKLEENDHRLLRTTLASHTEYLRRKLERPAPFLTTPVTAANESPKKSLN